MKKRKEFPKSYDSEIFDEFEKEIYTHFTALKRNKKSIVPMFIAGVIIYTIAVFYPWSDIVFLVMDKFVDASKDEFEAQLALVNIALSPLMVFISWLVFIVIHSIILKLTIKPVEVPDDIKGSKVKRMRSLMDYMNPNHETIKHGYSLLDKKLIKEGELSFGLSFAAIIPLVAAVLYFIITVVRSFIQLGVNENSIIGSFALAAVFALINFIPNLITIRILSGINKRLCGLRKYDFSLFNHIWYNWWPEIDKERASKLARNDKYSDSYLSTMAKAWVREQKEAAERTARYESWMRGE